MRKLLNTLYVTTRDSYLSRDGENIVIKIDNHEKFRLPIHNIESVVCFGYLGASPSLMALCAERNVTLSFLSENGYFLARVTGSVSGNVLLRRNQYRMADNPIQSQNLSKLIVAGKIANCRNVLKRSLRDHPELDQFSELHQAIFVLYSCIDKTFRCDCSETLRGIEGEAASLYFSVFDHLILAQKNGFQFKRRTRRPPLDNVNSLLSFCYILLMHEVRSALESVGLDPCVGFYHTDRPGRQSLALDLMEELRSYLADRMVLTLINRKQVTPAGFSSIEAGGIMMNDETRKQVISAWQKRKQEEITHPFLNEKIPVGLVPYTQALLLARYIRGDLNEYPVFLLK